MRRTVVCATLLAAAAGVAAAQTTGAITGRVRDAATGEPLAGVRVLVGDGRQGAMTDSAGEYRVREVRSGVYSVRAALIGYRPAMRDSVVVLTGGAVIVDFSLQSQAVAVAGVDVTVQVDPVLDPLVTATVQRVGKEDLRTLPVTTLDEAIALSAGAVGESYRGGRLGQQAFILDGLGVKNRLDASTGPLGVRLPADLLAEASLVTNGFSARYGQALSGMVNAVTKEPGRRWEGRAAYENDRPFGAGWDYGLDRVVLAAGGPIVRGIGFTGAVDAESRHDADPVNAPSPADPRDPRAARPELLPHNTGERVDVAGKVTVPLGGRHTIRVLGLRSWEQRLLFDPAYKYDAALAPAHRVDGTIASVHLQRTARPESANPLALDLRYGYFEREFARGTLTRPPDYLGFGVFTRHRFRFVGEDLARAGDTAAVRQPIAGLDPPEWSERTPWGVPAFFRGVGPSGEVAWSRYREVRGQLDVNVGAGQDADFYFGGEISRQRVAAFRRVLGYLPVGGGVPPPSASDLTPVAAAVYGESQFRLDDLAFTLGIRYDRFDARADFEGGRTRARGSVNPRLAVSTVLAGATFVASWGRFSQAPDYQYLVDAAFDDSTRTGRFRRGNPNLGFEQSTQYEFSLRARPTPGTALRVNAYVKRLDGLVASVPFGLDPDSTIFGNSDFGTVRGVEVLYEREVSEGWGVRVAYTLQQATATATDAYQLFRRIRLDSLGDTIYPARVDYPLDYDRRHGLVLVAQGRVPERWGPSVAGTRVLAGVEAAAIFRYGSGLPFSLTDVTGDTLIELPNSRRMPAQHTLDVLLRRPLQIRHIAGSFYLDVRNVLNRRNTESVRRDTGEPRMRESDLIAQAEAAYAAHPEAIPYESRRYRPWADVDGNGLIEGAGELMPLYVAAARDFFQPLFAYGPPRLVRLGVELAF